MDKEFSSLAIVVWMGAITRYGTIAPLVQDKSEIRYATLEEITRYENRP